MRRSCIPVLRAGSAYEAVGSSGGPSVLLRYIFDWGCRQRYSCLSFYTPALQSVPLSPQQFFILQFAMLATNFLFLSVFLVSTVAALSPLVHELQLPRAHIPYADDPDDNVAISSFHSSQNLPPYKTIYYFDQLIDHHKPELGTFKQRYWHNYEFYKPGKPLRMSITMLLSVYALSQVVLSCLVLQERSAPMVRCSLRPPSIIDSHVVCPGFSAYLTNTTINGVIAQALDGATVLLEHRFFGKSNPYPDLSVKSLQVHTIEQAIEDLDYFARNVHLPMPGGDQVAPGKAPWIMIGGSYPGALVSWAMRAFVDFHLLVDPCVNQHCVQET